jgi:hypothetical protein
MINTNVKIREKSFKDASQMWIIDQYTKEGLYLIKDASETKTPLPDQLVFIGSNVVGGMAMVNYIGNWGAISKFFGVEDEEDVVKPGSVIENPVESSHGKLSEEFALDMLSIAMHGTKAK